MAVEKIFRNLVTLANSLLLFLRMVQAIGLSATLVTPVNRKDWGQELQLLISMEMAGWSYSCKSKLKLPFLLNFFSSQEAPKILQMILQISWRASSTTPFFLPTSRE
jgi:hypothetical protein